MIIILYHWYGYHRQERLWKTCFPLGINHSIRYLDDDRTSIERCFYDSLVKSSFDSHKAILECDFLRMSHICLGICNTVANKRAKVLSNLAHFIGHTTALTAVDLSYHGYFRWYLQFRQQSGWDWPYHGQKNLRQKKKKKTCVWGEQDFTM